MSGDVARVVVNPGTPSPRCLVVRADQRLQVRNGANLYGHRGSRVVVTFGSLQPRTLEVGKALTFQKPVGEIVSDGFHHLDLELKDLRWTVEVHVSDGPLKKSPGSAPGRGVRVSVMSHCGVHSVTIDRRLWLPIRR